MIGIARALGRTKFFIDDAFDDDDEDDDDEDDDDNEDDDDADDDDRYVSLSLS